LIFLAAAQVSLCWAFYFVILNEGEGLLDDIADLIVLEADSLGGDTLLYITRAFGALSNPDGPAATAKALRILVEHMQNGNEIGMLQWCHCLQDDDVNKSRDMYSSDNAKMFDHMYKIVTIHYIM